MEQTVAPGTGLTARQEQFLAVVLKEKYLLDNFYLSGGTALSSWYLHHRESYDLDFFCNKPFRSDQIAAWIVANKNEIGYQFSHHDEDFGFSTFILRYSNDQILKIDFNHYTVKTIQAENIWEGLKIDSLYDIAVNKTQTIISNPRDRDYIDLFFILRKKRWNINDLLKDAEIKFGMSTDLIQVARNFLRVVEFPCVQKMLVPFDQKEMENFYLSLAKSLEKKIFK